MADRNRFVTLNRHVAGGPVEETIFSLAEGTRPAPGDGEVLLRPLALSVDPYLRGQMTGIDTFYLPQFALGQPITSLGVGRVVESRHPGFAAGDLVQGVMQWADYSLWSGSDTLKGVGALGPVDPAIDKLSHALGVYGLNGMTALFGMVGVARPEPGDTVLVSGAAGGIGAVAGQIARILGARVIGLAGSQAKCDTLVRDLGFDAALNYRSATLADDLRQAMPRGPDIYFDNVGGAVSQAVMAMMRRHTRVVECGQISTYDDENGGWTVDIRPIHANGLIWESFTTAHFAEFYPGGLAQLIHWVRAGKIKILETEHRGLEAAPRAMVGLLRGENIGKMVVTLE
ncbi:MDR family NADP-dependent oxidoreductase [Rhizorhabdus histidinilytica]|uniref:MDR family NADP-dependent oxidoreductase n=1 Tax=Rhizorhabdus histidinilytica TaxID=439228 RepID=UPI001ADA03AF|nr:NADP-dependent oxidoreductase [Rhizorhabdus histidinilytica]